MSEEPLGPLSGVRIVEFGSIGPGPHCGMMLADMGAEVLRIDRPGGNGWPNPIIDRGRATIQADIRSESGRAFCLEAMDRADVVIEGLRPGVMERLGLGPDVALSRNPRLIYGRMTGWGQTGPIAHTAGHDINYIGITGALAAIGKPGEPATVPMNLVGDFGGGSMFLLAGILAALFERATSGKGQVIDAAIVDGTTSLFASLAGLVPSGVNSLDRDKNIIGGNAPFYRAYLCKDGKEIAVGPLEPHFFEEFLQKLDLLEWAQVQYDQGQWPALTQVLERTFRQKTQSEWCSLFAGSDACVAPVLTLEEAYRHPQVIARKLYSERDGVPQPAPAPRFSRTPARISDAKETADVLERWNLRAVAP